MILSVETVGENGMGCLVVFRERKKSAENSAVKQISSQEEVWSKKLSELIHQNQTEPVNFRAGPFKTQHVFKDRNRQKPTTQLHDPKIRKT